jgi:hypothetical protein
MAIHKHKKLNLCQLRVCAKIKLGGWGGVEANAPQIFFVPMKSFFGY